MRATKFILSTAVGSFKWIQIHILTLDVRMRYRSIADWTIVVTEQCGRHRSYLLSASGKFVRFWRLASTSAFEIRRPFQRNIVWHVLNLVGKALVDGIKTRIHLGGAVARASSRWPRAFVYAAWYTGIMQHFVLQEVSMIAPSRLWNSRNYGLHNIRICVLLWHDLWQARLTIYILLGISCLINSVVMIHLATRLSICVLPFHRGVLLWLNWKKNRWRLDMKTGQI